ncbi:YhcN/YlaJ family sporulation lipoprotein [Desulforamulus ruminis]|uniref:YhcN/YlaJ family sporulation lipoprotein n=1 Tax=Desulforamulus ruminis TaxID=1564 RepID=UPI0023567C30|nr:YhcN/YlaJ family sporulation lipoprotein [Desulforamulus ruminis]
MKSGKKLILLPVTILLGTALALGGCTPAQKPLDPAPGPYVKPAPNTPATPTPTPTPSPPNVTVYPKHIADKVVAEANKVKGVRGSNAVVAGKNIYLGLDINANLEKNKSEEIERTVLNRVKNLQIGYTVTVTSDIDTATQINKVARGIAQGRPISAFSKELQDIGTRIN